MSLAPSDRLGPYGIDAPLGARGMGEVYRARDTTTAAALVWGARSDHLDRPPVGFHELSR